MGDTALLSAFSLREYVQPYPLTPQSEEQTALSQCERGKRTDVKCEVFSVGEKEKSVNWGLPRVGRMSLKVCVLNPWWGRGQAVKPESGMYWTQKARGK